MDEYNPYKNMTLRQELEARFNEVDRKQKEKDALDYIRNNMQFQPQTSLWSGINVPDVGTPTVWKREFGLLNTEKRESIAVAKKLLPGVSFLPTERSRVESDGMADAALLAIYASRHFKTGEAHD